MYGRYSKDLGEYAKSEARKLKMLEQRRKKEDRQRNRVRNKLIQLRRFIAHRLLSFCHLLGTIRQEFQSSNSLHRMDMEEFIRETRRGLGLLSVIGYYYGSFILYYGQRHIDVHKW